MNAKEIYEGLKSLGYPVAYSHFSEGDVPDPPYIVYFYEGTNNFFADGVTYLEINEANIELYSRQKDPEAEKKISDWLNENEIPYEKQEFYIESEKMIQVIFEVEI